MNQASVGFHCPECLAKEHTRVVRAPGLRSGQPLLTIILMATNIVVWVAGQIIWKPRSLLDTSSGAIWEGALFASHYKYVNAIGLGVGPIDGVAEGQWYRLLSSGFVHAGIIHLAVNMWMLYILGRIMETQLGRTRLGLIYFASLFAGSLGALVASPDSITVGASGAIFGLMGAMLAIARARGIALQDTGLLGVVVINLVITFTLSNYISVGGHVGGLIGGAIAGLVIVDLPERLRGANPRARGALTWALGIGLSVVFAVAAVVVANNAPPADRNIAAGVPATSNATAVVPAPVPAEPHAPGSPPAEILTEKPPGAAFPYEFRGWAAAVRGPG